MRKTLFLWGVLGLCLLNVGCSTSSENGNSGQPPPSSPPTPTGVTVSPATVTLRRGATQLFRASVSGVTDQSVVWSVNGARGGNAVFGLISADGIYIAPTVIPGATITVRAAPFSSPSVSGAASVIIVPGSAVVVDIEGNGARIAVPTLGSRAFSAGVSGSEDTSVTWQVNGVDGGSAVAGTITPSGVYTAPRSVPVSTLPNNEGQATGVIVTAVSRADPGASDSAIVVPEPPQHLAYSVPVPLGTSGSNFRDTSVSGQQRFCCAGTLGSLLARDGFRYILSNNHVLARNDQGVAGELIVQPGLIETGCSTEGTVLVGFLADFPRLENGSAPLVDAAIAEAAMGAVDPVGTIVQLGGALSGGLPTNGSPNPGPGVPPLVGEPVAKSGSATGITCGSILAVNVAVRIEYQRGCGQGATFTVTFTNQIDVTGTGFGAAGDSGSLIVTQGTADPVGLLYAGSDTDTVANPVADVLQQLADPVTEALPVFVGDPAVGAHPVAACTELVQRIGPILDMQAEIAEASPASRRRAVAALDARTPELLAHPAVRGVGVGESLDEPGDPAILIFRARGASGGVLPPEVDGIRTRIIAVDGVAKTGRLTGAETDALERGAPPARIVDPISEAETLRARPIIEERAAGLMARRGVQGVGLSSSLDAPGEAALMIFVVRGEPRDPVPTVIDGLRTRLRETSRFRAR